MSEFTEVAQTPQPAPIGLQMDAALQASLANTARWARFLAIVGFVMCGLMVLMAFSVGSIMNMVGQQSPSIMFTSSFMSGFVIVIYLLVALLYFFPCLYLFRFARKTQIALQQQNQQELDASFRNMERFFRFVGILTVIMLVFYALAMVGLMLGGMLGSFAS